MKCTKCGFEFEGVFCPECGTKCENTTITNTANKAQEETVQISKEKKKRDKIPWYFSVLFILIIYVISWWVLFIPAIILNILRIVKIKKKRVLPTIILVIVLFILGLSTYVVVDDIVQDNQFEQNLETGNFEDALKYLEKQGTGSGTARKYAKYYAAQNMYDEAVQVLLDYCNEGDILDISDYFIDDLDKYAENASEDIKIKVKSWHSEYEAALLEKEKAEKEKAEKEKTEKGAPDKVESSELKEDNTEQEGNVEVNVKGHSASDKFTSCEGGVPAEQIYMEFSNYENIYLKNHNVVKLSDEEKDMWGYEQLDSVDAIMSHYDENGLVGIICDTSINYFGDGDYWNFQTSVDHNVTLDVANLEGKTAIVPEDCDGNLAALFGVDYQRDYDYYDDDYDYPDNVYGTLTFHDMDRVKTEIPKDSAFGEHIVYSKKPVVKVNATINGEKYEKDFCLAARDGQYSDYKYMAYDDKWSFDLYFENDENDELILMWVDLESIE